MINSLSNQFEVNDRGGEYYEKLRTIHTRLSQLITEFNSLQGNHATAAQGERADTAFAQRLWWDGSSAAMSNPAAGRAALQLGSAATRPSTDFATAYQGDLADTALQLGDYGVGQAAVQVDVRSKNFALDQAGSNFYMSSLLVGASYASTIRANLSENRWFGSQRIALVDGAEVEFWTTGNLSLATFATAAQGALAVSAVQPSHFSIVGGNLAQLSTPAATRFAQFNAGGSVSLLTAGEFLAAIGASSGMANPMLAAGDLIIGGDGGHPLRFPAPLGSSSRQRLAYKGGVFGWVNDEHQDLRAMDLSTPAKIYGIGTMFGFHDAAILGISGYAQHSFGTLMINGQWMEASGVTGLSLVFIIGNKIWTKSALNPDVWGDWALSGGSSALKTVIQNYSRDDQENGGNITINIDCSTAALFEVKCSNTPLPQNSGAFIVNILNIPAVTDETFVGYLRTKYLGRKAVVINLPEGMVANWQATPTFESAVVTANSWDLIQFTRYPSDPNVIYFAQVDGR